MQDLSNDTYEQLTAENLMDISQVIAKIYRHSQSYSIAEFKALCFKELKRIIDFDAAIWITRSDTQIVFSEDETFCLNLPEGFINNYESLLLTLEQDQFAKLVISNPNQTIFYPRSEKEQQAFHQQTIYLQHCKKYAIEHGISTLVKAPGSELYNVIALYRSQKEAFFNRYTAQIIQFVQPHLIAAFQLALLSSMQSNWKSKHSFRAVCDRFGSIIAAEDGFYSRINKYDQNLFLQQLITNFENLKAGQLLSFADMALALNHVDNLYYIELFNQTNKLQALTKRETEVAHLLLELMTSSEIASQLTISVKTVDNHLASIFRKLECNNRNSTIAYLSRNTELLRD